MIENRISLVVRRTRLPPDESLRTEIFFNRRFNSCRCRNSSEQLGTFKEFIKTFPEIDTPEIFGLHPNADLTFRVKEVNALFGTLGNTQPKVLTRVFTRPLALELAHFALAIYEARKHLFPVMDLYLFDDLLFWVYLRRNTLLDSPRVMLISYYFKCW